MKKSQIAGGLNGLLAPTTNATTPKAQATTTEPEQVKGNYKTVCYSLPPDIADRIRAQAAAERRTIGAVVAQALADYLAAHGAK